MSRDEAPAEVRALATTYAAKFISKDDNDFAELHGLFCAAIMAALASRPAAPATDAESEPTQAMIDAAMATLSSGSDPCEADVVDIWHAMQAARPAPAPQAVEEVRREAAEDERDRLYRDVLTSAPVDILKTARWLADQGAMLPADRQRARAGQDGGA